MVIRRLALSSFFQIKANRGTSPSPSPPPSPATAPAWAWPSCKHPRTQSFHAAQPPGARTIASIFLDSSESSFTASSARHDCSGSLSTASDEVSAGAEGDTADDAVAPRGLLIRSSDRLLFDPGASATSSILDEKAAAGAGEAFVGGVAVAFESEDPYVDFRASMLEMVAAHGVVGDCGWLEKMLGWYLRANGKDTHGAIVAAFVDVVISIADPARPSCSYSSRSSSCTLAEGESEVPEKSRAGVLTL